MSKIIYNWKVAKRREGAQKVRRCRPSRKEYVQNGNNNSSASEASSNNSEDEVANERVNGYTRNSQINHQNNNKAKYVPSSSSDGEQPSTSFANHKYAKQRSDSEDSYKPNTRKRKKVTRKVAPEESSSSEPTVSEDDDDDDEDDSDNQPLSVHTNKRTTRLRPKKNMCIDDSSDSEGEISKMRTRQCKRPRYVEDSDSDCYGKVARQRNGENSDDSNSCTVTVSSRGRIRRLTARARALLKK